MTTAEVNSRNRCRNHLRPSFHTRGASRPRVFTYMLITLGIILLVLWLVFWLALHVTSGLIHLLLIVAVIMVILHFVRGRAT